MRPTVDGSGILVLAADVDVGVRSVDWLRELLTLANGLHALIGVFVFFGGLLLFLVEAVLHIARQLRVHGPVTNIYIENLHIHVGPRRSDEPKLNASAISSGGLAMLPAPGDAGDAGRSSQARAAPNTRTQRQRLHLR